jgi:hypothetical protein
MPTRTNCKLFTNSIVIFIDHLNYIIIIKLHLFHYFKFGSFRVDGMDYFIEPDEEFLSLGFNSFLSNQNIKNTEFSFVYIDHRIVTLQTHIIYKKAFDSLETAAKKSCALLGNFINKL